MENVNISKINGKLILPPPRLPSPPPTIPHRKKSLKKPSEIRVKYIICNSCRL